MMSHLKFSSSSVVVLVLISGLLLCSQCFNIIEPDDQILKVPQETSKPPRFPPDTLQSYTPHPTNQGFVNTRNGHFYLNDQLFDFRSLNAPTLVSAPSVYEVTDTSRSIAGFGSPVTRSNTLGVADQIWGGKQLADQAHISGWDSINNDWIYPELVWRGLDKMLAIAAEEGMKIIFPIINQDYGAPDTDWVGNIVDLIRHRYNITSYSEAQLRVDWFVDRSIRDDFKKIIRFMLTRVNTVNGRIYGEDDTFLAFETGNEMNWGEIVNITYSNNSTNSTLPTSMSGNSTNSTLPTNGTASFQLLHHRPAPSEWTIDIAKYIKSLAPKILVMDGSYARNLNATEAWPEESLRSEYIDIFSYHFYGDGELLHIPGYQARVESFGKTFVIGEHGLYSNVSTWKRFYDTFKGAGALIWSLREHSEVSGFKTNTEDNNMFSLHVPGFKNQTSKLFDEVEYEIIKLTYEASFDVLNQPRAPYPIPGPPHPFFATNSTSTGISFKGSAWADHYEIWGAEEGGQFVKVAEKVYDNLESGKLLITIDPSQPESSLYVPPLSYIDELVPQTGYVDSKWYSDMIYVDFDFQFPLHHKRSFSSSSARLKEHLPGRPIGKRDGQNQGGWFCVRGISRDGTPGVFSHPVYISASDQI